MSAASQNRDGERQPGEIVAYSGGSGYHYYKETLIMKQGISLNTITPLAVTGASGGYFLGVAANEVNLSAGLGSSQAVLNIWKRGIFTFAANGTGETCHIGQQAWGLDDQTVGISCANATLCVGEIVGIPTSSTYRVRIDNAIGIIGQSRMLNPI
jgi:hypothetical protein